MDTPLHEPQALGVAILFHPPALLAALLQLLRLAPPRDGGACQSTSRGQLLTALCKASTCSGWRNDATKVQQECRVCRESAAERAPQSLASTCVAASVWR